MCTLFRLPRCMDEVCMSFTGIGLSVYVRAGMRACVVCACMQVHGQARGLVHCKEFVWACAKACAGNAL